MQSWASTGDCSGFGRDVAQPLTSNTAAPFVQDVQFVLRYIGTIESGRPGANRPERSTSTGQISVSSGDI
jgi:hypothetical protein